MQIRSMWLVFSALLAGTLTVAGLRGPAPQPALTPAAAVAAVVVAPATPRPQPVVADSVVALALRLRGTSYCYAGLTPESGFDCSGFVTYVFGQFGVEVPHSSNLQATSGRAVPRAQARPGDIVIFTGTNPEKRTPGHAGIVISGPGEKPLRFVHSSSARRENGVKISQVDSTRYETRFLGIRRVVE